MGWLVNATQRPLYPWERDPVSIVQEATRLCENHVNRQNSFFDILATHTPIQIAIPHPYPHLPSTSTEQCTTRSDTSQYLRTYTVTAHKQSQHIHSHSTQTVTAHTQSQHTNSHSTYTVTAHTQSQHIHRHSTQTDNINN
jgi:hypothetical protein